MTDYILKEDKLQELEKYFSKMFEEMPIGISIVTPDGRFINANRSFCNMLGYTKDELVTMTFADITHPEDVEKERNLLEKLIKREVHTVKLEKKYIRKDVREIWISHTVSAAHNQEEEVEYLIGMDEDITGRRSVENELLRITKAVESSSDAIGMSDPRGHHFYQNRAFTDLFAYTAQELEVAGGPPAAYVDRNIAQDVFKKIMSGGSWIGEVEMVSKSGRMFPVYLRADAIKDETGEIIGLVGIHTDITERKKTEEAIKKSKEELQNNERDLRELAARLITNQEKELSRLARELHDDLTQRLAVLAIEAGNINLRFQDLPETVRQKISHIKDQLIMVSKDVHNLSRELHPSILDDLGLIRAIEWECANFSKRMGIAVIFTPQKIRESISKNIALSLYRIIQEGLSNVARHAHSKNAYVFLEGVDNEILLSIRDTGTGFDPVKVRNKEGLGLASMRERARLINGQLSITSQLGKGTLIMVRVPLGRNRKSK
jgi:PAS domain S-box-containing protein